MKWEAHARRPLSIQRVRGPGDVASISLAARTTSLRSPRSSVGPSPIRGRERAFRDAARPIRAMHFRLRARADGRRLCRGACPRVMLSPGSRSTRARSRISPSRAIGTGPRASARDCSTRARRGTRARGRGGVPRGARLERRGARAVRSRGFVEVGRRRALLPAPGRGRARACGASPRRGPESERRSSVPR